MDDDKIEALASSFYAVEYNSHSWNSAPEIIKDEFHLYARSAIELFASETNASGEAGFVHQDRSPAKKMYLH
jgi:hypothetical protein